MTERSAACLLSGYSIGAPDEFQQMFNTILNDVRNAAGLPDSERELVVDFPPKR
jgi:hypothetical protein